MNDDQIHALEGVSSTLLAEVLGPGTHGVPGT